MTDTLKSWVAVGHYVIPADHADRMIGGSTDKVRDKEEYAHLICRVDGKYQDDAANARLIAAAPDLLQACQAMIFAWETGARDDLPEHWMREAIEKATGKPEGEPA